MPFGCACTYMEYYPHQQELKLTWLNRRTNKAHKTTYLEVPNEVAYELHKKVTAKENAGFISKNIKKVYRVGSRVDL